MSLGCWQWGLGMYLDGATCKPRHARVLNTHSDMHAVPAFHCIHMFKTHFFRTRVFKTRRRAVNLCFQCVQSWESAKVSHKRVFALLTPEIHTYEMAQMLQTPVFALPGCQRMSVNTLLCDTLQLAGWKTVHAKILNRVFRHACVPFRACKLEEREELGPQQLGGARLKTPHVRIQVIFPRKVELVRLKPSKSLWPKFPSKDAMAVPLFAVEFVNWTARNFCGANTLSIMKCFPPCSPQPTSSTRTLDPAPQPPSV